MSFLQTTRTLILGNLNELLNKTIDLNSIPVLKQEVRNLEEAMESTKFQVAKATAQAETTLPRELERTNADIEADKRRAQAFLTQGNEKAAREIAARISDHQQVATSMAAQIETAKHQLQALQSQLEKMRTKHDYYLTRVRDLDRTDQSTKDMKMSNAAMKRANAVLGSGIDGSVDDVARRIEAAHDVAQAEFDQTNAELDTPEDPLKTQAVDDILSQLKTKTPTAA
jgi:phage shock protein A